MTRLPRFVLSVFAATALGCVFAGCGGTSTETHGTASYATCTGPGQCVALVPGCCGTCGAPTLQDVAGVNADKQDDFRAATCGDPHPVCPACPTALEPNLVAFCEASTCRAHDVREEDLSACTKDDDCRLRYPDCCETCGPNPSLLIAIATSRAEDYREKTCKTGQSCPKCAVFYPAGWSATCGADEHCHVVARKNLCPESQPPDGTPCDLDAGVSCEYGDDVRPGCRTHATCESGVFHLSISGCPPLPGPGEDGCPTTTSRDLCSPEGLACDLGGDTICVCSACLGGPCSLEAHWGCAGPPVTPGCPSRPPRLGAACDAESLVCLYGSGCTPPVAAGRHCKDGAWADEPLLCPV
ncbi:MAG TPA: hypothetical protein VHE30_26870 [Polyangiaceae bacterium]|nr:hypothetical protein [Polyangiaceae bacterium]